MNDNPHDSEIPLEVLKASAPILEKRDCKIHVLSTPSGTSIFYELWKAAKEDSGK